jgi:hypothetical protein
VYSQYGLLQQARSWGQYSVDRRFQVALYTNDHIPAVGDTVSDYDECAYLGYQRQALDDSFVPVWDDSTSTYSLQWNGVIFLGIDSATETCYGYFVVDVDGLLVGAELLPDGPQDVGTDTTPIVIISTSTVGNPS